MEDLHTTTAGNRGSAKEIQRGNFTTDSQNDNITLLPEPIEYAVLTSNDLSQTKLFNLNDSGGLEKIAAATAYDGYFKQCQCNSMTELNAVLDKLNHRQSLIIGTPHRQN
jgi:hypothetical protein